MSNSATAAADMYEEQAMQLVEQLLEQGIVEMPPNEPILIHVPTDTQFDSAQNLAHYHVGWKAGREGGSTN